jgi:1,4-alpha-glucan branching enzyme
MPLTVGLRHDDPRLRDDSFMAPPLAGLVIYQVTIDPEMSPQDRASTLDNIAALGVTAIELLPAREPAETREHYIPAHVAVERAFGGVAILRGLVAEAHRRGVAVIINIPYQRPKPLDDVVLDITQDSVRRVIVREALRWLRDIHIDGVRHDMGAYADLVEASSVDRAVGWQLIREMNTAIREERSNVVLIALDDRGDARVTSMDESGALFHTQWDMQFVRAIRQALDGRRPMADVRDAIGSSFGDTFSRTIYTHCAELIDREPSPNGEPLDWESAKRVTLGVSMTLTSPGIPMLFQGQEVIHGGHLGDDPVAASERPGFSQLTRDLVRLRRNWYDTTRGLMGQGLDVFHCNEDSRVAAWHRWADIGPGDDVIVVANLSPNAYPVYRLGFPDDGLWRLRFSSDNASYCSLFGDHPSSDVEAIFRPVDAQPASAEVSIAPYSLLVFSQDRWPT